MFESKRNRLITSIAWILAGFLVSACTLIERRPGADKVVVTDATQVTECQPLGAVTASVLHKVLGIERSVDAVAEDLVTVASNSAIDNKGDTLVPLEPMNHGQRRFGIYKCRH